MRAVQIAKEIWNNRADRMLVIALVGFFVSGLLIGWMWLGWWVWPVQYIPGGPGGMSLEEQAEYIELVAELYSYKLDKTQARIVLNDWGGVAMACRMAATTNDDMRRVRYLALAYAANDVGCSN